MSIYPEILAGYGATLKALEGLDVTVQEPGVPTISSDPIEELLESGPKAYSIGLMALREGVNVCRHGRYGFAEEFTFVDYPCATDAPDFDEQLRSALRPVVEAALAKAASEKKAAIAEHGPNGIEASDAVRLIG